MKKRYVLDGPPGAGKTTLMFGVSDGADGAALPHTLHGAGYHCVHESVAEAHDIMRQRGLDFPTNRDEWLSIIVGLDRDKYMAAPDGVTFYDRCFHHWKLLSDASGIPLPPWYDSLGDSIRYDGPVFLLAPIASIDLSSPDIHESRRFNWGQRLEMFYEMKGFYEALGYPVEGVPVFVEGDADTNNKARLNHILGRIGSP